MKIPVGLVLFLRLVKVYIIVGINGVNHTNDQMLSMIVGTNGVNVIYDSGYQWNGANGSRYQWYQ